MEPTISSGAGVSTHDRAQDPTSSKGQLVVATTHFRPTPGHQSHPLPRSPQGHRDARSGHRCRSSRTPLVKRSVSAPAPCEMANGRTRLRQFSATHKKAAPLGAQSHL